MGEADRLIKVYIAGKMTGLPDNNFPAFDDAAHLVGVNGMLFVNPAQLARTVFQEVKDGKRTMPTKYGFMRIDIAKMAGCDAVYILPGWRDSWGANWERVIASWVFDMPVFESIEELVEWATKENPWQFERPLRWQSDN